MMLVLLRGLWTLSTFVLLFYLSDWLVLQSTTSGSTIWPLILTTCQLALDLRSISCLNITRQWTCQNLNYN